MVDGICALSARAAEVFNLCYLLLYGYEDVRTRCLVAEVSQYYLWLLAGSV